MKGFGLGLVVIPLCVMAVASCQRSRGSEVLCETYVHRYGVEVPPDEWNDQGCTGKVVSTRRDGVTLTKTFDRGVLHGETTYTFPHRTQIECIEQYGSGQLMNQRRFFVSGLPREEVDYSQSPVVTTKTYYDQGSLRSVETIQNGRMTQGKYYNLAGNVETGVENGFGKRTNRDLFGQLVSVDTIKEGTLTLRTSYHPNGIPQAQVPYEDDAIHGVVKTFKPAGDPNSIERWNRGVQEGITTFYEDGEKCAEVPYVKGRRNGVERRFGDGGERVVEETTWVDDARHGPSYRYVNGQVVEEWYFRGQPTNRAGFERMTGPPMW